MTTVHTGCVVVYSAHTGPGSAAGGAAQEGAGGAARLPRHEQQRRRRAAVYRGRHTAGPGVC
jgi:hypothetical protein